MDPRFKFWRYITCLYVLDCVTDPKSSLMIYFSYLQTHDLMIFSVYYILISDEGSFVLNLLHTLDELYGYFYKRRCFISYPPLSLYSWLPEIMICLLGLAHHTAAGEVLGPISELGPRRHEGLGCVPLMLYLSLVLTF